MDNPALEIDVPELVDSVSTSNIVIASTKPSIVLYPRRWLILAIFSLSSMMNEVIWISLSSVSSIVQNYYNASYHAINWLAMIFSVLYFTVIFAVYILNKFGLKVTIVLGALLNAIGSAFRLIGYRRNGYIFAFIGNTCGGLAQSFLIFIPPTLSSVWFGEKERARASAIGMLMNMLGVALGFLMGSMFIPNSNDYDGAVKKGMFTTLLIQTVICSVLLIVSLVFIQKSPATPPTHSQAINIERKIAKLEIRKQSKTTINNTDMDDIKPKDEDDLTQSTGFFKNWKMLITNFTFHLMVQSFGIYFALFVTMNTLLNQMVIQHFPDKVKLTGLMGFSSVLFGLVSMMLAGIWIDKTHRYKFISVDIFGSCVFSSLTFTLVLKYSGNFALTFVCFCIHGICSFPYLCVGLEYIAEIMYPVKESILSFISLFMGTLYGTIFIASLGVVIHQAGAEFAGYAIAGMYIVGLICVSLIKGDLKRYNVDKERQARPE